jgi:hypothetical protein
MNQDRREHLSVLCERVEGRALLLCMEAVAQTSGGAMCAHLPHGYSVRCS